MRATTQGLTIELFGQPTLLIGGKPLAPLRTRKGFSLLALLALRSGRDVERSWLAGTLWADSEEHQALYNLRRSLSDLRHVLGEEARCVTAPTPHTLRLAVESCAVDVIEFDTAVRRGDSDSLDRAITLYTGRLLEGCLEEWAIPEAEARERAFLTALKTQTSRALTEGSFERAEALARQAISIDFTEETVWRLLFTALARQGNSAALTAAYRELRVRLQQDYNLSPDPQTAALYERLRAESKVRVDPQTVTPIPAPKESPVATPPHPLTSLIGRETQIIEIESALRSHRLVTLTGSGGVGKTRLALAVAESMRTQSPDKVRFVNMAACQDPRLMTAHLALAFNLREQADTPLETTLQQWLIAHTSTLILDNCEHLLEACATWTKRLLAETEHLRILATSRIALGITGELIWRVPSLETPPASPLRTPALALDRLLSYSAVQLFMERARNYRPDLRLDAQNAAGIAAICRQLDGIPLALELAAARVRHLALDEIARRLGTAITLLREGSPTGLQRWQTLQASLEWSWSLLTAPEQTLLMYLSVFSGGFTLNAAEAVCSDGETGQSIGSEEILDLLSALIDHSLIFYPDFGGADRYRLPETIRQYAETHLKASGKETMLRRRHLEWCLSLAHESDTKGFATDQAAALKRLEQDHDNFRAAFAWNHETAVDCLLKLRLAAMLWWFWYVRGHYGEGRSHMEDTLALRESADYPKERADVLNGNGNIAVVQGDLTAARLCFEECLSVRREMEDRAGLGSVYGNLGIMAMACLDYEQAQGWYEQSLAIAEESDDNNRRCAALNGLAIVAAKQGNPKRANELFEEIFQIASAEKNDAGMLISLQNLASNAEDQGNSARASGLYAQALEKAHSLGNRRGIATLLEALARLIPRHEAENVKRAALLMGAAQMLREQIGSPVPLPERQKYDELMERLREALEKDGFETTLAQGREMTQDAVIPLAVESSRTQ